MKDDQDHISNTLIVPTFFLGMYLEDLEGQVDDLFSIPVFILWIAVYMPLLTILRMRKLGFTVREMIRALVPFRGAKLRSRIWLEK